MLASPTTLTRVCDIPPFFSGTTTVANTAVTATDFGVKKSGHEGQFGRDKQEKATDALRSGYEKATG